MASTILLTGPTVEEIIHQSKNMDSEQDKSDTGDLQREIKKENESLVPEDCNSPNPEKKALSKAKKSAKPPKSFNHNFQKHAVITIKKLGRRMCQNFGNHPA